MLELILRKQVMSIEINWQRSVSCSVVGFSGSENIRSGM